MPLQIDYTKICFAVMPFGKKKVERKDVDFDFIYEKVFEPAISEVVLPEGGNLIPKRTDKDYFSANIDVEMYRYLEYSRFVLADISGLNANVFYELGIRHHANQNGTAIFRQGDKNPPFDISHIKAFPYEYKPTSKIKESKELIKKVLTESLLYNRIDSPVQVALANQKVSGPAIDQLLQDATNAIRHDDLNTAITKYKQAFQNDPRNPLIAFELALLLKRQGKWNDAARYFTLATQLSPAYGEAWRELGIVQNLEYRRKENLENISSGEDALKKSIELNDQDFDALASLGGIYKRMKRYAESAKMYKHSLEVSNGHPYPLINALILQIKTEGFESITERQKLFMRRAEIPLRKQVSDNPPYNAPWSFFDLSTILLFLGNSDEALDVLRKGLINSQDWQVKTHLDTLLVMGDVKDKLNGYSEIVNELERIIV